jgi:heme/copper-type cytochrome/quinol oxidase subunit 2
MNADASSGLDVAASLALDNRWLPLAILVTAAAALLTGVFATVTALAAYRRSRRQSPETVNKPELTGIAG